MAVTNSFQQRTASLFPDEELWLVENLFRGNSTAFDTETCSENRLLNIARLNGLAPLLHASGVAGRLSNHLQSSLRQEYLYTMGRNSVFKLIADTVIHQLSEAGIPVIPLKGIYLATNIYRDAALRPMGDIDLLVPTQKAVAAWQLLNGKKPASRANDRDTGHHLPAFNFRGANIELHRHLLPANVKYTIPTAEIWKHAIPGTASFALNPVHQIIYLLLHIYYTGRQGGVRLGWFYDIKTVVEHFGSQITLNRIKEVSEAWNVYRPVQTMLQFFTLLVPDSTLQIPLCADGWPAMQRMVQLLRSTGTPNPETGYGIAFERLVQTKGIWNKLLFIRNSLRDENSSRHGYSPVRVVRLFKNTTLFIVRKLFSYCFRKPEVF